MKIHILASDPGSKNYGIAVCLLDLTNRAKPKFSVLRYGMLSNPVNDLRYPEMSKQRDLFLKEVRSFLADAQVNPKQINLVICERFMTRGLLGTLVEYVAYMIGLLHSEFSHSSFRAIQASTWKNAFKARTGFKLDKESLVYAKAKQAKILPHEVDAILIGAYGANAILHLKNFQLLNLRAIFHEMSDRRRRSLRVVSAKKLPKQPRRKVQTRGKKRNGREKGRSA